MSKSAPESTLPPVSLAGPFGPGTLPPMLRVPESTLPPMLRVPEVATALGVGRSTIYKLLNTGDLASVRIGAARRIPAAALVAFLSSAAA